MLRKGQGQVYLKESLNKFQQRLWPPDCLTKAEKVSCPYQTNLQKKKKNDWSLHYLYIFQNFNFGVRQQVQYLPSFNSPVLPQSSFFSYSGQSVRHDSQQNVPPADWVILNEDQMYIHYRTAVIYNILHFLVFRLF